MKPLHVPFAALLLSACSPLPETDVARSSSNSNPGSSSPNLEELFRSTHGSAYDPASRIDREKMAALKGSPEAKTAPIAKPDTRQAILAVARPLVGQTESHGNNRSPLIDGMNRLTGVPLGSPYCASFNAWCYNQANVAPNWPRSAWSPDWVKNATWTKANGGIAPRAADAFGIWFASKGRVAHTGLIESWGEASAVTIEANTSPSAEFGAAADRDGDGIWRKRRLRSQIHSVRDWIGE